jgi:hypothetical protein
MTWISSLSVVKTCHRWNPEYPPGKPGKPHPVGCALNGEAEIEIEKDRGKYWWSVTRSQSRHAWEKDKKNTHALRAENHIYLIDRIDSDGDN